jgi:hypothetical protein
MCAALSLRVRLLPLTVLCVIAASWAAGPVASGATIRNLSTSFSIPAVLANGDLDSNNLTLCTLHYSINTTHHKLIGHGAGHVVNAFGKAVSFKNVPVLHLIKTVDGSYNATLSALHVAANGDCTFTVKGSQ